MIDIDPNTNPVFTAVDHIKDAPTAKLFLEEYAEQKSQHTEDESIKERPLESAYGDIRYVAGYRVDTNNPDKTPGELIVEKLAPWAEAYRQLSIPQSEEQ